MLRVIILLALFAITICAFAAKPAELMIWAQADDLQEFYADGDRVNLWPEKSGGKRHLRANGENRPTFVADALPGHAVVRFAGDARAEPKITHALDLPLSGEWRGVTIFIVGVNVASAGLFQTAPGSAGSLRAPGYVQLVGTKASVNPPFPALTDKSKAALVSFDCGIDDDGLLTLTTYANGQRQQSSNDPAPLYGVVMNKPSLGTAASAVFSGDIAEVIIYRGQLTAAERAANERYLMQKYRLGVLEGDIPPAPIGYLPPVDPEAAPLPAVVATPITEGAVLWLRADDLFGQGITEGTPVAEVPNAAGGASIAGGEAITRPTYAPAVMNARPALRFNGSRQTEPKTVNYLRMPYTGETEELTLTIVGRHLTRPGVFDLASGGQNNLRMMGAMQITGREKFSLGDPFPLLRNSSETQTFTVVVGKIPAGGQYLETYANGHLMHRLEDTETLRKVSLRNPTIGTTGMGQTEFNGDIAEVLLVTRALTAEERRNNDRYLAEKWGIRLLSPEELAAAQTARSRWSTVFPQLPRTMSWYGNSFSGKTEWVQSGISGICVLPDGTVAATSIWDEPHKEIGFYKDGKPIGPVIKGGSSKITFDDDYFYAGRSGMGKPTAGVRRLTREGVDAPWPELGAEKWITFATPEIWCEVSGIQVTDSEIFVCTAKINEIRVYDKATGAFKRAMPIAEPGSLLLINDLLWLGNSQGVASYTLTGAPTGKTITGVQAGAIARNIDGTLAVADNTRNQVVFYDITGAQPVEVKSLFQRGGVWADPVAGELGNDRQLVMGGLGFDDAGNLYLHGAGFMRAYSPDGVLQWQLYSTVFCLCSDVDPVSDGKAIYSKTYKYSYQPGQHPEWIPTAYTVDRSRFPEFSDGSADTVVLRRINGTLYRFGIGMNVVVHRKEADSEIFVPCALYAGQSRKLKSPPAAAPDAKRFLWTDRNDNGLLEEQEFTLPPADAVEAINEYYSYNIDEHGGIWEPFFRLGVRHIPVSGFTPGGAPIYDMAAAKIYPRPKEFSLVMRACYFADTDTMYLAGYTWDAPALGNEHWGNCGREVIVYDDWTKETRHIRARMPYEKGVINVKAITIINEANLLFVGQMETSVVFVYDTTTGKLLGIVEPDPQLVGGVGWIDRADGIRARQLPNGEILLIVEDSWAQKEMIYRIPADFREIL